MSLKGVGESAAMQLEKVASEGQEFMSIEDFKNASGVGESIIEKLKEIGALDGMPETNQVTLFGMV